MDIGESQDRCYCHVAELDRFQAGTDGVGGIPHPQHTWGSGFQND